MSPSRTATRLVERAVVGVDALEREAVRRVDAVVVGLLEQRLVGQRVAVVLVRRIARPVPGRASAPRTRAASSASRSPIRMGWIVRSCAPWPRVSASIVRARQHARAGAAAGGAAPQHSPTSASPVERVRSCRAAGRPRPAGPRTGRRARRRRHSPCADARGTSRRSPRCTARARPCRARAARPRRAERLEADVAPSPPTPASPRRAPSPRPWRHDQQLAHGVSTYGALRARARCSYSSRAARTDSRRRPRPPARPTSCRSSARPA